MVFPLGLSDDVFFYMVMSPVLETKLLADADADLDRLDVQGNRRLCRAVNFLDGQLERAKENHFVRWCLCGLLSFATIVHAHLWRDRPCIATAIQLVG